MTRNISHVRIVNAPAESHVAGPLESGYRRGWQIEHLVGGMETGEVQGDIGAAFSQYPVYQLHEHLVGVVQRGDHEVNDLEMGAALGYLFDARKHRLQFRAAHVAIKIFAVTLQVYLDCVENLAHLRKRRLVHEAAAYQCTTEALFLRITGDVYHVFGKDRWLIIGKGDDARRAGRC